MSTRGLYVLVKVLSVHRNYAFPCCVRCSTRIRTEDDENIFSCSKCQQKYDKQHISYRYKVNMTVSDRTQVSNVTVFGHCLENFFETSARSLKRFVEGLYLEKEEFPLPVDQLVHQCIEQCFVGSMIRLCFRGLHPCLTDSQASRSSPPHLKNILTKIHQAKMNYLPRQQQNSSHLLASYMSRPEDTEKSATVFDILKEYLVLFRCSKSITPSGCTNVPNSMSSSGPKRNTSFQSHSRLHYKEFGRKSYEDFNFMVSPLVLSCETRESSQSPPTGLLTLNKGGDLPIQIDSEIKSQSRMQYTPSLDNSPNRTALMLVSLLNMDTSEEFIDDSSSDLNNGTNNHDKSRSLRNTSEHLKCSNDPIYLTENAFHDKHDNKTETPHTEELAYLNSQSIIGKPVNIRNAIENEKQEPQYTCAWPENDDQKDMDSFLDEDLNSFFANLSLDCDWEGIKDADKNSQYAKGEKSSIEDQHCHHLDDSREFQDHLPSECNSLREEADQNSISFPEDVLTDLEFSNFSFMYEYENLQEPRPSISKTSHVTSSQEHKSQNKEHPKDSREDFVQNSSKINCDSHVSLPANEADYCRRTFLCYSSTDKPQGQYKFSVHYRSESLGTPAQLSSLFEQTSTPVLFDDSRDSNQSKLELHRFLSLTEAIKPADVMERAISLNIHSTPLNSECKRKFKDLSGDLKNYSGLFVDDRKKHISISPTVSLNAKAPNKGCISCDEDFPTTRKISENKECLYEFSSARSHRRMEGALEREEDGEQHFVESFSVRREARQERWHRSDQICPESPLLFSFSSTENTSCRMTPDIQQDSLLCASLLECSYLK